MNQETRIISNKQPKLTPKAIRERTKKPKVSGREANQNQGKEAWGTERDWGTNKGETRMLEGELGKLSQITKDLLDMLQILNLTLKVIVRH